MSPFPAYMATTETIRRLQSICSSVSEPGDIRAMVNILKFLTLLSVPNNMLIFSAGIHKMLGRIANREDPDQTSSEVYIHAMPHTVRFYTGDKIFQNLALLKADSHKIFKSHRIFRPSKTHFVKR